MPVQFLAWISTNNQEWIKSAIINWERTWSKRILWTTRRLTVNLYFPFYYFFYPIFEIAVWQILIVRKIDCKCKYKADFDGILNISPEIEK